MRERRERGESPVQGDAGDTGRAHRTRDAGPCPVAAPRGREAPPVSGVAGAGAGGAGSGAWEPCPLV